MRVNAPLYQEAPERKEDNAGQAEDQTVILERHRQTKEDPEKPTKVNHQVVHAHNHVAVSEGSLEENIFVSGFGFIYFYISSKKNFFSALSYNFYTQCTGL